MVNLRKRQAKAFDDAPSQYAEQRYGVARFWTAVTDSYPILMAPESCSSDESESDSEDKAPDQVASQKHADRKVDRVTPQRGPSCEAFIRKDSCRRFPRHLRQRDVKPHRSLLQLVWMLLC